MSHPSLFTLMLQKVLYKFVLPLYCHFFFYHLQILLQFSFGLGFLLPRPQNSSLRASAANPYVFVRPHVRLCECMLVWLFTSSTVAAGLTTLAEWILIATCVSAQLYFIIL